MSLNEYDVPVNFTTTIDVTVKAQSRYDAMCKAEELATETFRKYLDDGLLGMSDFIPEAQEP